MICRLVTLYIAATGVGLVVGLMVAEAMLRHLEAAYNAARETEEGAPEVQYAVTFSEDGGTYAAT